MHKKLVTLALSSILSLSLSLTGCNSNEDVENPQVKQEETVKNEASHEQDEVNKEEQVNPDDSTNSDVEERDKYVPADTEEEVQSENQEKAAVMLLIMCDLKYYENVGNKMADITDSIGTTSDYVTAYAETEAILEEVKTYENCDETTDLKGYLVNMLISTMECIDYMYQNNEYSAEKALNDVQTYASKYQQEYKRLTNEYYSDNTEAYN